MGLGGKAVEEKKEKNLTAVVKKLVSIRGSVYLCIPKSIVQQCQVRAGDEVGIVAGKKILTVILGE